MGFGFTDLSASHILGGDIRIEYIGDSTNTPKHYRVYVNLYRRFTGGASLPSSIPVKIDAPCFSNTTINLARFIPSGSVPAGDGGFFPFFNECASVTSGNFYKVSVHSYKMDIILGGNCQYKFSAEQSGRTFSSNLNPYSGNFYIEALLNVGPWTNSSPKFEEYPRFYHCLNQNVNANFSVRDDEGDSIYYTRAVPQGTSGFIYSYQPAYSKDQFLTTVGGVSFDSLTGQMAFQPNAVGRYVAKVKVREYRFDTISNTWNFLSTISNDLTYYIESSCDSLVKTGMMLKDSTGFDTSNVFYCSDTTIDLRIDRPYLIRSLAANGSDFSVRGISGKPYTVVGASFLYLVNSEYGTGVRLYIQDSITQSDTLIIKMKAGTDTNSLYNHCGFEFSIADSVMITALDTCTKVSQPSALTESELQKLIEIYPNPASDKLNLKLSSLLSGSITKLYFTDVTGKVMLELNADQLDYPNNVITTSSMPKGVYSMVINFGDTQSYSQKFFIQ